MPYLGSAYLLYCMGVAPFGTPLMSIGWFERP